MSRKEYFIVKERYDEACKNLRDEDVRDTEGRKTWTATYHAEQLDCTRRMMGYYLSNEAPKPIPYDKLCMLAEILRISPRWLCGEIDDTSKADVFLNQMGLRLNQLSTLRSLLHLTGIDIQKDDNGFLIFSIDERFPMEKWNDDLKGKQHEKEEYLLPESLYDAYRNFILEKIVSESRIFLKYSTQIIDTLFCNENEEIIHESLDNDEPFNY